MKRKSIVLTLCALFVGVLCIPLFAACTPRDQILRIFTCEDYLSYSGVDADVNLDEQFAEYYKAVTGKKVKVEVKTFLSNEEMYAKIATKHSDYDIVVPSDYMVEKMINNNLLLELSENLGNDVNGAAIEDYRGNIAPFAQDYARRFYDKDYKYSRVYMWGTLGVIFNPALLKDEDKVDADGNGYPDFVQSWDCIFNNTDPFYKERISVKNSQRDTIAVASIYNNKAKFTENGKFAYTEDAKTQLSAALNATDANSLAAIKQTIIDVKQRNTFKGFDDEDAKAWALDGELACALQWQGDSFGCITEGASLENPVTLDYYVPDEGSNIFFDAWCIPKYAKNVTAAQLWINFMCKPSSAIANMEYIGYTSAISSPEILEWCNTTYADFPAIDLSYFFGADAIAVHADPRQYLPASVIARCEMMKDYGDAQDAVTTMWNEAKGR